MSGEINFTADHKARLDVLLLKGLHNKTEVSLLSGAKANVYDLLHNTTVNTLSKIHRNLKKEIDDIEALDEWSLTDYQQRKLSVIKETRELINLLIGFKRSESIREDNRQKIAELKAKAQELKQSAMTPQEQLDAINAQIAALSGEPVEQTAGTTAAS